MTHVPPALEILEPVCQAQNVKEEEDLYQVKTIHLKIQKAVINFTLLGTCANGFGSCCLMYLNTCGGTVNQNCTYIQ